MKPNYIGGAWLEGASARPNINPSDTTDVIDEFAHASADHARMAIEAAMAAQISWAHSGIQLRADTLGSLPDAFANIASELRTQYSIGYYPTNSKKDGTFRAVKVQVSAGTRRIVARTRNGYTAPREGEQQHSSVNK